MNLNYKRLLIIISLIAAIIILPDLSIYNKKINLLFEKTVPNMYKHYPNIDKIKDDYYELKIFKDNIDEPFKINDSTMLIISENDKNKIWYKINSRGNIIDSLCYNKEDNNKYSKEYLNSLSNSSHQSNINQFYYNLEKQNSIVRRTYVHKDSLIESSFWSRKFWSYGTGNSSVSYDWYATGYYEIIMPKRILKFKRQVLIQTDGTVDDRFPYIIYKPLNDDLLFLYSRDYETFLIKPIKRMNR